jgi:hypothetical protein
MAIKANLSACYIPSKEIAVQEIGGELLIVLLSTGIGDVDGGLFTVNEQGRAVWSLLEAKKTLKETAEELVREFEASPREIERDVIGFVEELLKRKMLVESPRL